MGTSPSNRLAYVVLILSLLIGVVAIYVRDATAPPDGAGGPVRVYYASKGGAVVFDHALHTERESGDCVICHHYDGEEEEKENCRDCHLDNDIPVLDGDGGSQLLEAFNMEIDGSRTDGAAAWK